VAGELLDPAATARLERVWAQHARDVARELARIDPSLRTTVADVADGLLVLQGPGMYVNRALAVGLTQPIGPTDLDLVEERSAAVGVAPAVELVPISHASITDACRDRGYRAGDPVSVLTRSIDGAWLTDLPDDESIDVRPIAADDVGLWQDVSEAAWELGTDAARLASRRFVAAVHAEPHETLLLARDATDGRPLGCATVIVRDGVATLGGMSTLPAARRRGVQRALVRARLAIGLAAGCELAAVSAVAGGASARNLVRLGFVPQYDKVTVTRHLG
jgi:GNAT superfamily N-acetyltransferase